MFRSGDRVGLRHGTHWDPVVFLCMADENLSTTTGKLSPDHLQAPPGGEPTALIERDDGTRLLVLLEDLKELEEATMGS